MNDLQVAQQVAYILGQQTWPDAPNEVVFGQGGTYVTAGPAEVAINDLRFPYAIVRVLEADPDDEEPALIFQTFEVEVAVLNQSDTTGEFALIGGPRSAGQGSSSGRGLLEIGEEVLKAIGQVDQETGITLQLYQTSSVAGAYVDGSGYVAVRSYQFLGAINRERYYHPASGFSGTVQSSGDVVLTWALPPDRYDRNAMVLRRAPGATPPVSATAGTGITLSGPLATTVTDTPGSGTFSYALFAGYDETGGGTNERFSASVTTTEVIP